VFCTRKSDHNSEILDMNLLAPDIQEQILPLSPVQVGKDGLLERDLRPIAFVFLWSKKQVMWKRLVLQNLRQ